MSPSLVFFKRCLQLVTLVVLQLNFIEGYCLENVAQGKPTHQPATAHDGLPELAVDGDENNEYYDRSCTFTLGSGTTNPYWQVDLQAEYSIRAVTITNRADDFVWRLNNFDIEVYQTNPLTDPATSFEKCLTFPGSFGPVTRTLFCDSLILGRYVRIRKNTNVISDGLTLCEVAVHAYIEGGICDPKAKRPSKFISQNEVYMNVSGFKEFTGSLMSCMVECFWLPMCDGFNFNGTGHGNGSCELIPIRKAGLPLTKSGWTFYEAVCA